MSKRVSMLSMTTPRNGQSDDHQVSVIYVKVCDSELWYAYIFACSIEFSPFFLIAHNKNTFSFFGKENQMKRKEKETFLFYLFISNSRTILKVFISKL